MDKIEVELGFSINDLLQIAMNYDASDLHITVDIPPVVRVNGILKHLGDKNVQRETVIKYTQEIMTDSQFAEFEKNGELDFSYSVPGFGRFRINAYHQRGSYGLAARVIPFNIPTFEDLRLPQIVQEFANLEKGLIIVTGPTGSGKSTTLASIIDLINNTKNRHIMTLEDPIEYLHRHKKSIVNQREVGFDTYSFANGLRAALRQDPDVILVGEMRDLETIATAVTAAETGHLVLATLHTSSAPQTIDRIIDVFPPHQQQQIRIQLAGTLQAVIAQQLIPRLDGKGRVAGIEILVATPAVRNQIREAKSHQIFSSMQTGSRFGMKTMDNALMELYQSGLISLEEAKKRSFDVDGFVRLVQGI